MFINEIICVTAYKLVDKKTQELINSDVNRYLKWDNIESNNPLVKLKKSLKKLDYRSVFRFRIVKSGNRIAKLLLHIENLVNPFYKTVEIGGDIKGGLMVSHSVAIIAPRMAGENLRVGPGTIIGRIGQDFPKIGDNVYIGANCTVVGNVTIGSNVIIGAGSVVVKDIPTNSVAVGNPARVIRPICEKDYNEIM